ncbi:hypothetical protein [Parasitella parasitica]|uniref:Uncharacterized protein n=1 Tax=Parasitella parasitica TaxID=35722 RepID=A0A0B7NE75_9FUNG|nr:hypothetical protein [Parasitella parasitica]
MALTLAEKRHRSEQLSRLRESFSTLFAENPTKTLEYIALLLKKEDVNIYVEDNGGYACLGMNVGDDILLTTNKFDYTAIKHEQEQEQQQIHPSSEQK